MAAALSSPGVAISPAERKQIMTDDGLDSFEELILQPLEDSPLPLWELHWFPETSLRDLAAVLTPALLSLANRGLIEVRQFRTWPLAWTEGSPLTEPPSNKQAALQKHGPAPQWTRCWQLT